jgi:hypothetical protein
MKTCTIYQPSGLGDIIWLQPIVNHYSKLGYKIHFPVCDFYYEIVKDYIKNDNIIWHKETDDYPLKKYKDIEQGCIFQEGENLFLALVRADRFVPRICSVMISKYYVSGVPVTNWHENVNIKRNHEREQKVFDVYGIDKMKEYVLINPMFGTPPSYKLRNTITQNIKTKYQQIIPNYEIDSKNNINVFDWIGIIENAIEIHTVETAFCYFVDKFSKPTTKLYMYEKRLDTEPHNFYYLTSLVYRNPNWTFME